MLLTALAITAQLAAARPAPPLIAFPDAALDDTAAYPGYRAQLHRDIAGNTLHIQLSSRDRRIVHVWADAENESLAFTVRAPDGSAVPLAFGPAPASTRRVGRWRHVSHTVVIDAADVELAHPLLGSMRVERDVQYWGRHLAPNSAPPFRLAEFDSLVQVLRALPGARQARALAAVGAPSLAALEARLVPTLTVAPAQFTAVRASLDGRDSLRLELRVNPSHARFTAAGHGARLTATGRSSLTVEVRVATTGRALTALDRREIFTPEFLRWLAAESTHVAGRAATDSAVRRVRRMERQVRGVELLASREKLMAGLPTYATYFGRDMLVSALMMQPIWRPEMAAYAIGAALGKLGPDGGVSHEEALGEQAVREAAADYVRVVRAALRGGPDADARWTESETLLRRQRRIRENYHMVDDEFQLPILVARWMADPRTTADAQRRFFRARVADGRTHLVALRDALVLVARRAAPYAATPVPAQLVSFGRRDSLWASESWRDSGAGYGNGRFAMDVNALYVPAALDAIAEIHQRLTALGLPLPPPAASEPLARWLRDASALSAAITTWRGAIRHFDVTRTATQVQQGIAARLATLPAVERDYWTARLAANPSRDAPVRFLALALDSTGAPVAAPNSDPATRLFLASTALDHDEVLRDAELFADEYPRGLLVPGVGPMVVNDALATPAVWQAFDRDPYHGPKVAWGREVNLFVLGVARQLTLAPPSDTAYRARLRAAIDRVQRAVDASGFHAELWSHAFRDGRPQPARYGSGNDVQLWSTTDLVVHYTLSTLR